jgi:GMP synthase-like glutamine amidotransferase
MGQIAKILPKQRRVFATRWAKKGANINFSPEKHAGLIILGDDQYWATSDRYQRERAWLAAALEHGTPVLGICYGAQLLAAHLEGRFGGKPLSRFRTRDHRGVLIPLAVEGKGKTDPVIRHLAGGAPVAQYHVDSFQEPSGATALAWSKEHKYRHCEAFRVGSPQAAVYGLQFHPEPTIQMLQDEGKDERWFESIPPLAKLQHAVEAGETALRAWIVLATAHRVDKGRESN